MRIGKNLRHALVTKHRNPVNPKVMLVGTIILVALLLSGVIIDKNKSLLVCKRQDMYALQECILELKK